MLFRYLTCRTMIGVSPLALISSMAALLAPLLSMVTFSGTPLVCMALSKKRRAATLSRLAVSRKSTVGGNHHDHNSRQQAKTGEASFAIVLSYVFTRDSEVVPNCIASGEVKPVVLDVQLSLIATTT